MCRMAEASRLNGNPNPTEKNGRLRPRELPARYFPPEGRQTSPEEGRRTQNNGYSMLLSDRKELPREGLQRASDEERIRGKEPLSKGYGARLPNKYFEPKEVREISDDENLQISEKHQESDRDPNEESCPCGENQDSSPRTIAETQISIPPVTADSVSTSDGSIDPAKNMEVEADIHSSDSSDAESNDQETKGYNENKDEMERRHMAAVASKDEMERRHTDGVATKDEMEGSHMAAVATKDEMEGSHMAAVANKDEMEGCHIGYNENNANLVENKTKEGQSAGKKFVDSIYLGATIDEDDVDTCATSSSWSPLGFIRKKLFKNHVQALNLPINESLTTDCWSEKTRDQSSHSLACAPKQKAREIGVPWDIFANRHFCYSDMSEEDNKISQDTNNSSPMHSLGLAISLRPCLEWTDIPIDIRKALLKQPLPGRNVSVQDGRNLMLDSRVLRSKAGWGGSLIYTLVSGHYGSEQVLVAAKKSTGSKTPYYLFSTDPSCFVKTSSSYVGKLRGNWMSTEYICYGEGKNPRSTSAKKRREELCAVKFKSDCTRGHIQRMEVIQPRVYPDGSREVCRPTSEKEGLRAQLSNNSKGYLRFVSKLPTWDYHRETYTMNFHGRSTRRSSKNFQLIDREGSDAAPPLFQFARCKDPDENDRFQLDATHPFSILQAFCFALTVFDAKTMESVMSKPRVFTEKLFRASCRYDMDE